MDTDLPRNSTGLHRNSVGATPAHASSLVVFSPQAISALVAAPSSVHPLTRRLVDGCDRERVRGRLPVPRVDLAVGRWPRRRERALGVCGVASRADVPGASRLGQGRRQLERVGNRRRLRSEVTV